MINQFDVVPDMHPQKRNERLIVLFLSFVLVALLGGYIYYGIYLAKQGDVLPDSSDTAGSNLSPEERAQIISGLEAEAEPLSTEDRAVIVTELEAETAPLSAEARDSALKDLESPSAPTE